MIRLYCACLQLPAPDLVVLKHGPDFFADGYLMRP